ncbi:MAG: hypothetical protein LC792_03150, partial [Actinobacteria bacterium]|nr:hypothetical protein [Actinomycetota bacterium]
FQSNDLDALAANSILRAQPAPPSPPTIVWDPTGFVVSNEGMFPESSTPPNDGLYGPDSTTLDRSGPGGARAIQHGWCINGGCMTPSGPACPDDPTCTYLEWRREGAPSFRRGIDMASWPDGPTPDDLGYGDFGPDTLTWMPQDTVDHRTDPAGRTPYLSLASYGTPTLSFLTRFAGTPNTAFVVEMQVPQRVPCVPVGQNAPGKNTCSGSGWNWVTPAFPLMSDEAQGTPLPANNNDGYNADPETISEARQYTNPGKLGAPVTTIYRNMPSNPLAAKPGFWDQKSSRHPEDGGWVRIHIPLTEALQQGMTTYCRSAATTPIPSAATPPERLFLPAERDPCAFAHADDNDLDNGLETYVARPVRFRFRAASYGGDAGESAWQIADLSVTDHRLRFLGPAQVSVAMNDNDNRTVPVRIANQGSVPDRVEVAWAPTRGHTPTLGTNGSIALSTMPDLRDAAERLVLDLAPGQARVVWVRIHTGIISSAGINEVRHIPFLVQARSLIDPTLVEGILVDARFTTHAWPDLVATKLVLGDNAQGGMFEGSVRSPLKATLVFRNVGELPIGSPSQPIRVSLVAQELDENGTLVPGTRQVVDQQQVASTVLPQRQDSNEHFVNFAEWLPERLGLFQLSAELNAPGIGPALPESSRGNNAVARLVAVGPIRFADLNITDLWAVEFHGTCGEERVERLVAGHAYCLAARVENRGLRSALDPRIDFGVGSSAPFSSGAPSLAAMVPRGIFPAAETLAEPPAKVVVSSPRAIVAPPASSSGLVFYAEVSSRSIMPNFEGKSHKLTLPVDVYQIAVGLDAQVADISPGREVRIPITLGNRGNAPATAGISLAGDAVADLEIRLDGVRTLLPGENATVTLTLAAGRQLDANAHIGALALTVAEDSRALIPLGLKVNVADGGLPDAQALSLWAAPGAANATLVLDAASSPVPYLWRAESVKGPLRADAGWEAETHPFDRQVVSVPLTIAATAAPGTVEAPLRLVAEHDGVEVLVPLNVTLEVAPRPALSARLVLDHRTAAPGAQAAFALQLNNTGNVPLSPRVLHRVDLGAVTPDDQAATLLPGQGALLPFTALAGPFPRALGQTEVAWSTP